MVTFKEYLISEVECYIENVEDDRACDLSDKQAAILANTIAEVLSMDEWLSEQIMGAISDEYEKQIQEVL